MNAHEKKIEELFNTYLGVQEEVFGRPKYYFEEEIPLIKSVIAHCYLILTNGGTENANTKKS
jgi:hypothetical protein